MEALVLIGGIAVLAGFAGAFALTFTVQAGLRRRWTALAAQGERPRASALFLWRLRNGYAALFPLCGKLLGIDRIAHLFDELCELLSRRGHATTAEALASVTLVAAGVAAIVSGFVTRSAVGAVAVPTCGMALLAVAAASERDKRQEEVRDAVPGALESMSACFGSGFTLLQTFQQVAQDVPGPLGATFSRSAHVLQMGGSAQDALAELRLGAHASELAFVAVALDVQHQSGGAMRQVLDAANDTVKGELSLKRSLRVQTAQAKLSARVVAVMPFILVAVFSLISPDFLAPFFQSAAGYALLTLAIVMQVAGVALVRRALAVDGVS